MSIFISKIRNRRENKVLVYMGTKCGRIALFIPAKTLSFGGKMKNGKILGLVLGAMSASMATPPYLWIATSAIDKYAEVGTPSIPEIPNNRLWGDKFMAGAAYYVNYNCGSNCTQPTPYRNMNLVGPQVTNAALTAGTPIRMAEMVVTSPLMCYGHGTTPPNIFLGHAAGQGNLSVGSLPLGGSGTYNHWAMYPDNNALANATLPQWSSQFNGLQGVFGFSAVTSDAAWANNPMVPESLGIFWRNWAYFNLSQWDSWRYAATYMGSVAGVTVNVTMVSGQNSAGSLFYPKTFTQTTDEAGIPGAYAILTANNF